MSGPLAIEASVPRTSAEKVTLFRSLFRGREDVFATRFVSKNTGKPGYAPACSNKWDPGLCALKIGGKCGDCANQAFIPFDDAAVFGHLTGRHVMGVYPLLENETCWCRLLRHDTRPTRLLPLDLVEERRWEAPLNDSGTSPRQEIRSRS